MATKRASAKEGTKTPSTRTKDQLVGSQKRGTPMVRLKGVTQFRSLQNRVTELEHRVTALEQR
jgi:hypothetical protein